MKNDLQNVAVPGENPVDRHCRAGSIALGVALVAALTGCAGNQKPLVLDAVGPAPTNASQSTPASGTLVVYSSRELVPDFDLGHQRSERPNGWASGYNGYASVYSRYQILTSDGKQLRSVGNNTGDTIPQPERIVLPAGHYSVAARSTRDGLVQVPVVIAGGQVTVVRLDDEVSRPGDNHLTASGQ